MLSKNQRIGLKYFDDFQARIPRDRVSKIYDSVVEGFKCLVSSIDLYQIEICGSFRRGKQTCGDIDIIITRKDGYFEKKMLLDLILKLE
jgi:DNA polymerase lambda